MITHKELPQAYKPYQQLKVCSNTLIGGGNLIALGEVLPLLVGSGESPLIWLQAPTDETGKNYISLVAASVASHHAVSVVNDKNGLTVSVGGTPLLLVKQTSAKSAEIKLLDLRPIGLNIYGNETSLTAGGATFSHNTFNGFGTMMTLGGGLSQT
ncbi:MAG: hypothetical protein HOP01_01660 [Gallionella sp.]|nr:hypothetical protein [Gallionella sp.]